MKFVRFASFFVLAMSGCTKPAKPWIDRLEVEAFEGGEVISLSKDQLRELLVARLTAAKFTVAQPGQKPPSEARPWRIELAAGLTEPELEEGEAFVLLALDVRHTGDAEPLALTSRQRVQPPAQRDVEAMQGSIRGALEEGLTAIVREAGAVIALDPLDAAALAQKLKDGDAPTRRAAVRLLVRRHDQRALPELLSRLQSDEVDTLRETVGLLVELKAPESVNPLIEAAHQRGPIFQREVVFAVGSIGGIDAEAYLDLVSTGHDDALVRASAEQALSELRARLKKSAPPQPQEPAP